MSDTSAGKVVAISPPLGSEAPLDMMHISEATVHQNHQAAREALAFWEEVLKCGIFEGTYEAVG